MTRGGARIALAGALIAIVVLAGMRLRGDDGGQAVVPAQEAIAAATTEYQVVLVGEVHQWSAQHRFFRELIASSALERIDDIVVEFGNARYQATIDAYVSGAAVPLPALRRVWEQTTQGGVWQTPDYAAFFAAVRRRNLTLPRERRLRVLLGDPPIDATKLKSAEEQDFWDLQRDEYLASVIQREVVSRGRRALVVAGYGRVLRDPAPAPTLTNLLEGRGACETDPRSIAAGINWCDDVQRFRPTRTYVVVPGRTQPSVRGVNAGELPVIVDLASSPLGDLPVGTVLGGGAGDDRSHRRPLREAADGYLMLEG